MNIHSLKSVFSHSCPLYCEANKRLPFFKIEPLCLLQMFWSRMSPNISINWRLHMSLRVFVWIWAKNKVGESIKERWSWIKKKHWRRHSEVFASGIQWVSEPFLVALGFNKSRTSISLRLKPACGKWFCMSISRVCGNTIREDVFGEVSWVCFVKRRKALIRFTTSSYILWDKEGVNELQKSPRSSSLAGNQIGDVNQINQGLSGSFTYTYTHLDSAC